jgi:myo-inositol-1(or 4)-monophosphatase
MDVDRAQRVAIKAAYKGAEEIRRHFGRIGEVDKKGPIDLVTTADRDSEKQIIATIREVFPGHAIMAEESGRHGGETDVLWVIDPLDGTTNFAHGVPIFAVSIALCSGDRTLLGVILNPVSGELFSAIEGRGALLNGKPVSVTKTASVAESLLVTGFSYRIAEDAGHAVRRFERCLRASRGVRRLGAAALDLCFVACGRFDAFWERDLKPWDTAAGVLVAGEAGARISTYDGSPFRNDIPEILATNGMVHDEMIGLLRLAESGFAADERR